MKIAKMVLNRRKLLILAALLIALAIGVYALLARQSNSNPKTLEELLQKYEDKTHWTVEDAKNCQDDYRKLDADARKPKPGVVIIPEICPGIPK